MAMWLSMKGNKTFGTLATKRNMEIERKAGISMPARNEHSSYILV